MLVPHSHFLHSSRKHPLNFQLYQTPWQLTLSESHSLPSLFYFLAVLLDPASKLVCTIFSVVNVLAQLLHQTVVLLMMLLKLLWREVRVPLIGELGPLESFSFFAEGEDLQEVSEVVVVGSVPQER